MYKFPRKHIDELDNTDKPIKFQITDWYIPENDKKEEIEKFSINIYGTNNENITICVNVIDYNPFFYVKPPDSWEELSDKHFKKKVDELNTSLLEEKYEATYGRSKYYKKIINNNLQEYFNGLTIENKKDFWGFTNNKVFRFIKVSVKSLKLYNNLKYYFLSLINDGFKLYESNIDPFLKFIHIQKIKPCGWVNIEKYSLEDAPNSRCDYNITAKWSDIIPLDINYIAPLIIASFDIECTSSHGDFPVAKKDYKKLAQDLCMLVKSNNFNYKNIVKSILLAYENEVIIKDDYKINRLYAKSKNLDYKKIEKDLFSIEKELNEILSRINIIQIDDEEDDDEDDEEKDKKITVKEYNEIEDSINNILKNKLPELEGDKIIQIGTTVHQYGSDDIIYKNIITLNTCDDIDGAVVDVCKTEKELLLKWKQLMFKLNPDVLIGYNIWGFDMEYMWFRAIECGVKNDFAQGLGRNIERTVDLVEQKLASSALGENILKYFDMDGTVIIDVFKVMQRDQKLDSYKLDNVASIFIGENKDDLKPNEIFEKFKGGSNDRCIIAKYCIQDCILVNRLMHKLKIIENNIGMANVCLVPLNFLFKRGQGIKIFSLICNECMMKDYLIPVIKNFISDKDDEGYEGAIVLEPKEGIYLNEPIVVFDYGSLYPSSMISRNLSHDTYVFDKKYMNVKDPNVEFITVNYDLYEGLGDKKHKSGIKECVFAQYKNGKKGIIPEILNMLLEQRKNTRNKIEYKTIKTNKSIYSGLIINDNDEFIELLNVETKQKTKINKTDIININDTYNKFEKDVFDALQSAYKVTANSLYGQIGARTSPIYLKDIAACTTSTGREMIMLAKNFVETNYNADVIYGDTDSIFCKFPIKDINNIDIQGKEALPFAIKIGQSVEKNIAGLLPKPQKLNYEKCLFPFILFSKKRYVGNLYETDVNKFKQKSMGIVLKRRDNANIVKKIYGGIIDIILNKQDIIESVIFLKEELNDLVNGKTDIKDLILSKTLRSSYKDPTKIAHKVLADRIGSRDSGNKPACNDRIQYVYIKVPEAKLQGDRIETPEFILENNITPDYLHYITNQIMKPVLQLYALCLEDLPNYDEDYNYWDKIDEELKLKPLYQDDKKRKNRLDNLKLKKVQELLFDEFINKLKEPKIKIKKEKVVVKKEEIKPSSKVEINETVQNADGIIKIILKQNKFITVEANVIKNNEMCWIHYKEGIENKTKDEVVREVLIMMIKNNPNIKIKVNINYKKFIKDYNLLMAKYDNFIKSYNNDDKHIRTAINNNDIGKIKEQKELLKNEDLLVIKDFIIIE